MNASKTGDGRRRRILKALLPLIILAAGGAGAVLLDHTGPRPQKKAPNPIVALVEVVPLQRGTDQVVIEAMGTVVPAREMTLKSQVSGEVIHLHPEFVEGGLLRAGDELLRIDPVDYELAIQQKQSQLANAVYGLKVEEGYQDVARREWELLGSGGDAKPSDVELALRKPHLRKARADLGAAEAELAQARLDLARTRIQAPFNAVVRSRDVAIGSQVTPQDALAELVGTDAYWIQASLPVERLGWIDVPRRSEEQGARVSIHYGGGHWTRSGRITKLLSDLEPGGRMARILIEVDDPLDLAEDPSEQRLSRPPLLIGEYVQMEVQGAEVSDVFRIPRTALKDGDHVWIAEPGGTLAIRKVDPVWRGGDVVLVAEGLSEGDRLIVTGLPAPVAGMPVRVVSAPAAPGGKTRSASRKG
jgi:RND family efflux transporter MFP subunit